MSEFDSTVESLITVIHNTKEYQTFLREKEKVARFPELKQKINEYRLKNYELQNSTNDDELFDKMEEFDREYEEFRDDPLVSDFLEAELDFCRMMQDMNMRITAALDFD